MELLTSKFDGIAKQSSQVDIDVVFNLTACLKRLDCGDTFFVPTHFLLCPKPSPKAKTRFPPF